MVDLVSNLVLICEKKKKKSLREIKQQKRESLRKERGIEKTEILRRERATEKERDSMREERRESLPKRELKDERLRRANDCLECFTENLGVKQLDVK
jgi:hypothetical protein